MNPNAFRKETYIRADGGMNFPNFQAHVKMFADTVWQRSKEENAKGFEFFASLWKDANLRHRGACERNVSPVKEDGVTSKPKSGKAKK